MGKIKRGDILIDIIPILESLNRIQKLLIGLREEQSTLNKNGLKLRFNIRFISLKNTNLKI